MCVRQNYSSAKVLIALALQAHMLLCVFPLQGVKIWNKWIKITMCAEVFCRIFKRVGCISANSMDANYRHSDCYCTNFLDIGEVKYWIVICANNPYEERQLLEPLMRSCGILKSLFSGKLWKVSLQDKRPISAVYSKDVKLCDDPLHSWFFALSPPCDVYD